MTRSFLPIALAASMAVVPQAFAQEQILQPKITVTGEGEARLSPDMAIVTLAVTREAETARAAMDDNSSAMAAVIAALKEEGIEARDLQTSGLSIQPQYVYPNERNEEREPRIVGYQVSNQLTVRIRDMDKVGAILDRSVSLGVNQGGHIAFTNDDPTEALTEARKRAVEDAMTKARTLADAAGVNLGKLIELSESAATPPPMPMAGKMMRAEMAADAAVPIEAGENSYTIEVNVTFSIEQ
ncbi:SIMPL domain-containing protein [Nitratireductor thuwali]|uniref:26 kDa periplasmic immunogenic protein n=1 Tax=Nitratireductor thuwali TaxID=2267699 RepID=A0ABY5MGB6_9HYPH|nr:26 kDa periplasmic immunogenic protein [Nitratireductor thuwali]